MLAVCEHNVALTSTEILSYLPEYFVFAQINILKCIW